MLTSASLADALYAMNAVLLLVIAVTSARYYRALPIDQSRIRLVVLAISLLALSDGARYWWFAIYRMIGNPPWMLDHAGVVGITAIGTISAFIFLRLYAPVGWYRTLFAVSLCVAGVIWHFMP